MLFIDDSFKEFPKLISYSRFVYLMKNLFIPLFAFLLHSRNKIIGVSFVDSTKIQICQSKRISRNKVFAGWFYGFKLHLIINDLGGGSILLHSWEYSRHIDA